MSLAADFEIHFPNFHLSTNFHLGEGEVLGIWGPSGSGKSSILKAMSGILDPTSGSIRFRGKTWLSKKDGINLPPEKRHIGFVLQEPTLFPHFTVQKNIAFGEKNSVNKATFDRAEVLKMLDCHKLLDRFPRDLSGGEQQRVALARGILTNPDILLLDEPVSSQDPLRKKQIFSFLKELPMLKMIVSHNPAEIEELSDQVLILQNGKSQQSRTEEAWQELYEERDAFSVLEARIIDVDPTDGLCRADCDGMDVVLPTGDRLPGDLVQIKLMARDVSIGLEPAFGTSILNAIPVTVDAIAEVSTTMVLVRMSWGQQKIVSHITKRSKTNLKLESGKAVFAFIKGMAIRANPAPGSIYNTEL